MEIKHYRDLNVYKNAMSGVMQIFTITKSFPADERFSLTDQVRRSSRSLCANVAEAWRKRRYRAAFIAKLSDAESEAAETQVWMEIARNSAYIEETTFAALDDLYDKIQGQLVLMADQPEKWLIKVKDSNQ